MATINSIAEEYRLHPDEIREVLPDVKNLDATETLYGDEEDRLRFLLDHPDAC